MYVLKSTKKLTTFKQFAITPSAKECTGFTSTSAFISPLKLKKLEKRHGVNLLGGNSGTNAEQKDTQQKKNINPDEEGGESLQQQEEESATFKEKLHELNEKNQALLKDNDAMDQYMKDLCQKYF